MDISATHLRLSGVGGRLLVGPYVAATLGGWTCERGDGGFHVTWTVTDSNGYWRQRPVDRVELKLGASTWTFRAAGLDAMAGSAVLPTAPEKR